MITEFKLPDLGEGIHEAEIVKVKVEEGQTIKEDQPIFEVETDKAVVEIPSPVAGLIEKVHVKEGAIVTVGSVMITFAKSTDLQAKDSNIPTTDNSPKAPTQDKEPSSTFKNNKQAVSKNDSNQSTISAAPAVRHLARELGVDLASCSGSGPSGRILKEDVLALANNAAAVTPQKDLYLQALASNLVELPDFSKFGTIERVPLKSIRRKIASNMALSWAHIPRVAHFDECDITELELFRGKHEKDVAKQGGKLTLTVLVVKAIISGLIKYPQFNTSLDETTGEIIYKHYYNIGIAVATERGLIVPVIHNANHKTLTELALELSNIAQKTRNNKIELEQLQGGTFTITNLGSIGGTGMVPMINFPEAAILGMAKAIFKPVVINKQIEPRLMLPLSLAFDHRITDGAEAAYFVKHVISCLEDPAYFSKEI